jgi:hypothetical protein
MVLKDDFLIYSGVIRRINTPRTTLRFIGFVAKISVLNPKLPADDQ